MMRLNASFSCGSKQYSTLPFRREFGRRLQHFDCFASWNQQRTIQHLSNSDLVDEKNRGSPESRIQRRSMSTVRAPRLLQYRFVEVSLPRDSISSCHLKIFKIHPTAYLMYQTVECNFMRDQLRSMNTADKSKVDFSTLGVSSSYNHSTDSKSNKVDSSRHEKDDSESEQELSTRQKVQRLFKKYGVVFVGTYFGVYVTTLFSLFGLLESGLLDPDTITQIFKVSKDFVCETADVIGPVGTGTSMDEAATAYASEVATEITQDKRSLVDIVTGYLQKYEWSSPYVEKLEQNPHLANLAVAWVMIKFTEPFRLAAAVFLVPKVAKLVGRKVPKEDLEAKI